MSLNTGIRRVLLRKRVSSSLPASIIKSLQQVTVTIGDSDTIGTTTITSVDKTKSIILWGNLTTSSNIDSPDISMVSVEITDGTTITAERVTASVSTVTVYLTVVEFESSAITSIQHLATSKTASSTVDQTISSVNPSNSIIAFNYAYDTSTTQLTRYRPSLSISDSTTVTILSGTSGTGTIKYSVIEFDPSVFNSIQQVVLDSSTSDLVETSTITSVDTSKSAVFYQGQKSRLSNYNYGITAFLTNATTLTYSRYSSAASLRQFSCSVVEFKSDVVKSVQRYIVNISSLNEKDQTISEVNLSKAIALYNGYSCDSSANGSTSECAVYLTSSTNLRVVSHAAGSINKEVSVTVIEFY